MSAFEMAIPAARGRQARREYYVSAVPLRYVARIFRSGGKGAESERHGRTIIDKKRVTELARYILDNPAQYIIPPIVACIDGRLEFEQAADGAGLNTGCLRISMDARISTNGAQIWIAAIETAIEKNPELGSETVSAVLIPDAGMKRYQQVFADLSRYSVRPSASLSVLYDQRGEVAQLAKGVMNTVPYFADLTETEKSSISNRSTKLFTLSAIHSAVQTLLAGLELESVEEKIRLAAEFWIEVGKRVAAWQLAKEHKVATADLRRDYIHSHALALAALARAGNQLIRSFPRNWKAKLKKLSAVDWSRNNVAEWEGRAMNAGRLSKRSVNVTLTANLVKKHLGLPLSSDEEKLEHEFQETRSGGNAKGRRS